MRTSNQGKHVIDEAVFSYKKDIKRPKIIFYTKDIVLADKCQLGTKISTNDDKVTFDPHNF